MIRLITTLFYFTLVTVSSQNTTNIKGLVYSYETKMPLEFVNIGIVDQPIGTITNSKGEFSLNFTNNINYKINFSFMGYQSILFDSKSFIQNDTVFLSKSINELKEIIVINNNYKIHKKGSLSESLKIVTGWSNGFGNGSERGILIKNKKGKHKINKVFFHVASNSCDTTFVRIRIREIKENIPIKELISENIVQKIIINNGWINFDLSNYDIVYDKDILVSLEWLKSNKKCDFLISGNYLKGTLYYKEASDAEWKIKKRFSPSIYISTINIK